MRAGQLRRRCALTAGLGSVFLAACNMITGLDADYQQGGGDSGTRANGEAGEGGGASDGQTSSDARRDGASDAEASPFCVAAQADSGLGSADFFCADFEDGVDGTGVPLGWSKLLNNIDGGSIELVADGGTLGSRGLLVSSASSTTASRQTRLVRAFDTFSTPADSFASYEFDFDFKLLNSTLDYDAFGLLVFANQVAKREHGIAGYSSGAEHLLSHQAPIGLTVLNDRAWHHVRVTLTRVATNSFNRTIYLDSVPLDAASSGHSMDAGAPTEVWMGIFNTSATAGSTHAQFDNVVFQRRH